MKKLLTLFLFLLWTAPARPDAIDEAIRQEMRRLHIPGLSLAIVRDGRVVKTEGYGMANLELKVPSRPETVYKIGSVSKQFLAAAILLLVQEGRLRLDDRISQYLDGTPEPWREITLRHLLTHTSGMARESPAFSTLRERANEEILKGAYSLPLLFAPGERYAYSNLGYFCLAEILVRVTGKPWSEFLAERLFRPVGMIATRTTTSSEIVLHRADGYIWRNDRHENAGPQLAVRPSGAFLSTVLDLAKWDAALDTDWPLLSSTREQMWKPVRLNSGKTHPYGFGWMLESVRGHRLVRHGGSLPGFRAEFRRYLDDRLSIILLTNADQVELTTLGQKIASLLLPDLHAATGRTATTPSPGN